MASEKDGAWRPTTAIVGGGSWGSTLAHLIGEHVDTRLWARTAQLVKEINATRRNGKYLPQVRLPDSLVVTNDLGEALKGAELILVAVPSHGLGAVVKEMAPFVQKDAVVVSMAKGLEEKTMRRMSQVIATVLPNNPVGVLSGPNLAHEIAAGFPTATVVAFQDRSVAEKVQEVLHGSALRVYTSVDVVGCEVAGAAKNVIAIAVGISDAVGFGDNTRAVLITRGLAEQARLGEALGGNPATFAGLAGVGDLVATCTSAKSRNRSLGFALGKGAVLSEIVTASPTVAEGVRSAAPLVALASSVGVEMPIAEQVAALISGQATPLDAVRVLMDRPARAE